MTPTTSPLEDLYITWRKDPKPGNMHALLKAMDPFIHSQVLHLTGSGNPAVKAEAKLLAAEAIRNFNPVKGTKLTTYVGYQLQPLRRVAMKYDRDFKIPEKILQEWSHIKKNETEFESKNGRSPSIAELADHMGLSVKRIAHVKDSVRGVMSESQLAPGAPLGSQSLSQLSAASEYVYNSLPGADQKIFDMKTGFGGEAPMSVDEISEKLGMHPSSVSQKSADISRKIIETETYL